MINKLMRKWNYPLEYLKKDGKLKKNCLKKAIEWRKNHPPKFLPDNSFNKEQIIENNKRLNDLLENVPYPSYQHMNRDIIDIFAKILIVDPSNNHMNSIEECELFRYFCIMNKRLCFLDKDFRKKYNIKNKIEKCKLIYETEKIVLEFKKSPTRNWLPFNKPMLYNYQQNRELFSFIKENYSSYATEYGERLLFKTQILINTIKEYHKVKFKHNDKELELCFDTELSGFNLMENQIIIGTNIFRNTIYIYNYIHLIKAFKMLPEFYEKFIVDLRKNLCESQYYWENEDIEKKIKCFIRTLLY